MAVPAKVDSGSLPATLTKERNRIDELVDAMLPGVTTMLKAAADSANGKGLTLNREQASTIRALDGLLQRKIQATKADADIAHMDQLTAADLECFLGKVSFYTGRALKFPLEQIGVELRELFDKDPIFKRVDLSQRHIDKIVAVACAPNKTSIKSWRELLDSGVLMDHDVPVPQEAA